MTGSLLLESITVARAGRPVVRDVDLEVAPGRITALLGANGAGKSSLVQAVAGLLPLQGGAVRLGELTLSRMAASRVRAAGVAVVPEGHRVFAGLTVSESLRVAGSLLAGREVAPAVDAALQHFPELRERLAQDAGSLSGGQQQMLAIAGALVAAPRFLIIDELSLGLAPVIVRRLLPVVEEVAASGVGILLVEQFAHVALGLADAAAVMERGRLVFNGPASELAAQPELLHGAYLAA